MNLIGSNFKFHTLRSSNYRLNNAAGVSCHLISITKVCNHRQMMMNCCNHEMLCNRVSWMSSTIEDSLQSSELCAFKITTDYCLVRLTIRLMKRHSSHFFILFEYFFCFVKENKLLLALTTRSSKLWSFRCDFFLLLCFDII